MIVNPQYTAPSNPARGDHFAVAPGEITADSGATKARIYAVVARIPAGRVSTYGRVAALAGLIRGARTVGWALKSVPDDLDLPCHRVVNRIGFLSGGWHFGHPDVMRGLLVAEGVGFVTEYQVDLSACLWEPGE